MVVLAAAIVAALVGLESAPVDLARQAVASGAPARAVAILAQVPVPLALEARLVLAQAQLDLGRPDQVLLLLEGAPAPSQEGHWRWLRGQALAAAQRPNEAMRDLAMALGRPGAPADRCLWLLTELASAAGDHHLATVAAQRLMHAFPDSPLAASAQRLLAPSNPAPTALAPEPAAAMKPESTAAVSVAPLRRWCAGGEPPAPSALFEGLDGQRPEDLALVHRLAREEGGNLGPAATAAAWAWLRGQPGPGAASGEAWARFAQVAIDDTASGEHWVEAARRLPADHPWAPVAVVRAVTHLEANGASDSSLAALLAAAAWAGDELAHQRCRWLLAQVLVRLERREEALLCLNALEPWASPAQLQAIQVLRRQLDRTEAP